ncbi:MAG: hypothetical protein M1409_07215 [Actinobacteria bacterium]|nr:hypothetical protein [Actinomycetota bacterium]
MPVHPELDAREKRAIIENYTNNDQIFCVIGSHPIDDKNNIEYHHLNPFSNKTKPCPSNFGVVCKGHHREIGTLSINEFKTLKEMEILFKDTAGVKLNDVVRLKLRGKKGNNKVDFEENIAGDTIKVNVSDDLKDYSYCADLPLYTCPATGFKYFYIVLSPVLMHNDEQLQPRPLEFKRLWDLYRHLLVNSQLTPSVCRLEGNNIFLFDGQHKAAAQIWAGREEIECKVYISPDIKILKETNLAAHDRLRQMPFFASVLINKWASIFNEEWKDYMDMNGEKSEAGFVSFLVNMGKKRSDAINMIESDIYDSIIEDKENEIIKYIAEYNSDGKKPLTISRLKQVIFKKFIAGPPLLIDIEESDRLREFERKNLITLLNLIARYTLEGKWNPEKDDESHKISERIYLTGSFKAWSSILKDVIAAVLELYEENERKEILLREINESSWESIEECTSLLFEKRVWLDESQENYNNLRAGNENLVRKYLSRRGISVNDIISGAGVIEDSNWVID